MKKGFLFLLLLNSLHVLAQNKNRKPAETPQQTIPKVAVTIAGLKGGDITPETLAQIVDSSLTAKDTKGETYSIVRFRVLYKFKSTFKDEDSGQTKTTDDLRTNDFANTGLMSELWRQSIKDNIQKGDEMTLDNIIVRLKNGSKIMSPAITFKVI